MGLSYLLAIFLSCLFALNASSQNFTVTTTADSGPGSLRQAMLDAAANGPAVEDFIHFNLPGTTVAERTIYLASPLPLIVNVTVDGSTQPGAKFGVSDAKVCLRPQAGKGFDCFTMSDDSKIYGLMITGFHLNDAQPGNAITVSNLTYARIGEPGKGNVLTGNTNGIYGNAGYGQIRSNFIGIDADGVTANGNINGITLLTVASFRVFAQIGGDKREEGNVITGNKIGVMFLNPEIELIQVGLVNNSFGTDYTERNVVIAPQLQAHVMLKKSLVPLSIRSCVFTANAIGVDMGGESTVDVQNCFFGTTRTNDKQLGRFSGSALYGHDSGDFKVINTVFAHYGDVISTLTTSSITLSGGSFYCNDKVWFYREGMMTHKVGITEYKADRVAGWTNNIAQRASVGIYYGDATCGPCNPKEFVANVPVQADGTWSYDGPIKGPVMVSFTPNYTFGFYQANLSEDDLIITHIGCGKKGSIKPLRPMSGNFYFRWKDEQGQIVSTQQDANDLQAGRYYLEFGMNGGCEVKTELFTILSQSGEAPVMNEGKVIVTDQTCGNNDGSIKGIEVTGEPGASLEYQWINEHNIVVSTMPELVNAVAGKYRLVVKHQGAECGVESAEIEIKMVNTELLTLPAIVADTCGLATGSITGITHRGTGVTYTWTDETGKVTGVGIDLRQIVAGKYHLLIKSGSCESLFDFVVPHIEIPPSAPEVTDIFICAPSVININITGEGDLYRLYDAGGVLLQESRSANIKLNVTGNADYFAAIVIGNCESERMPFKVWIGSASLKIPKSFSPNNDGIYDTWHIKGLELYTKPDIRIFNRFGTLLYHTTNGTELFDGKNNGVDLPAGTYWYIIKLTKDCKALTGSVTILR
jgi:gliding motility-associated-like protein